MTKSLKIYIAGSEPRSIRAKRAFRMLAGRVDSAVTTLSLVSEPLPAQLAGAPVTMRARSALQRLEQIRRCHVFWMLVPRFGGGDLAWVEMGYAQACVETGKTPFPHMVFSGETSRSIYCALDEEFETDEAAATYIAQLCADTVF